MVLRQRFATIWTVGKLRLPTPKEKLLRRVHLGYEDGSSMEEDEVEEESAYEDEQSNASIDKDEERDSEDEESDQDDEECIVPKQSVKASRKKRKLKKDYSLIERNTL